MVDLCSKFRYRRCRSWTRDGASVAPRARPLRSLLDRAPVLFPPAHTHTHTHTLTHSLEHSRTHQCLSYTLAYTRILTQTLLLMSVSSISNPPRPGASPIPTCTHSHSHTRILTHVHTHKLTQTLKHSHTRSLPHSFTHLHTHSNTHTLTKDEPARLRARCPLRPP